MAINPPDGRSNSGARTLSDAVLALATLVHQEGELDLLIEGFLDLVCELLPGRVLAVRVVDLHSAAPARAFARAAILRTNIENERLVLQPASLARCGFKPAVLHSARVRIHGRWDSPFRGVGVGFSVPLAAAGDLQGVLDIGYPVGLTPFDEDEGIVTALANHLSVAILNHHLQRDANRMRDYQSRLVEQANALILGVDRDWRVTVFNKALAQLTNYDAADVIGRDLRDALPEDEVPRFSRLFSAALSGARAENVEVALLTSSGTRVRTVWNIAAIDVHDGISTVVAIGQDQTRIRELQSQIIHTEKLATLGQLAAGVVHEINNPLTSITVYADYLLAKAQRGLAGESGAMAFDAADIEKLARIRQGAQRILELSSDLVKYGKPAGDEFDAVNLNSVVLQSLSFCEHLFERQRIAPVTHLDDDLPLVSAVPRQLEQVLVNVITNACHAIEGAVTERASAVMSGRIAVETGRLDGARVFVAVSDSGPGVAAVDRDTIFEPFFTTKIVGKGTGLGLSIARNIVAQHGGSIQVEEADGGGARFVISLPSGG